MGRLHNSRVCLDLESVKPGSGHGRAFRSERQRFGFRAELTTSADEFKHGGKGRMRDRDGAWAFSLRLFEKEVIAVQIEFKIRKR